MIESLKCVCRIHPQIKLEIKTYQDLKLCIDCINKFLNKLNQVDDSFKIKFDYPLWRYVVYGQGHKNLKLTVYCKDKNHLI